MKNTGIVFGSLLCGMLVGSAIAMLLTPKSGPELRSKIKDYYDEGVDALKEKVSMMEEKLEEARCNCNE